MRDASSAGDSSTSSFRCSTSMTIESPSRSAAIGPPTAASGATWPTIRPRVAPLKRPSVRSATDSPRPSPTGAAVERPLVARHLHHTALRREVAAEDDQPSGGPDGLSRGAHHLLPRCLGDVPSMLVPRLPVGCAGPAVQASFLEQPLDDERDASCPI